MSWDVRLEDRTAKPWCSYGVSAKEFKPEYDGDELCTVPCYPNVRVKNHREGGTYAVGGTSSAELNVTYNYGRCFREVWDGVGLQEALNGKRAEDVIGALEHAVRYLGTDQDGDYWSATAGNAGYALSILVNWARQHPTAVFQVS